MFERCERTLYVSTPYEFLVFNNNMQTLKFKAQPMVYIFCCGQSSKQTSQETEVHSRWVKRSHLVVVIGRFDPFHLFFKVRWLLP